MRPPDPAPSAHGNPAPSTRTQDTLTRGRCPRSQHGGRGCQRGRAKGSPHPPGSGQAAAASYCRDSGPRPAGWSLACGIEGTASGTQGAVCSSPPPPGRALGHLPPRPLPPPCTSRASRQSQAQVSAHSPGCDLPPLTRTPTDGLPRYTGKRSPSFATSAINRRSHLRTRADVLCDVRATVIFHTDTPKKKCFISILPSKEFAQRRRTY